MPNLLLLFAASALTAAAPAAPIAADRADLIERLSEADLDRDGKVQRAELIAWRSANFARFDRNGDKVLSDADVPKLMRSGTIARQIDMLEAQFDFDRDGKVQRAEFVDGPTTMFDLADRNRDRVVTRHEIDLAAREQRAVR